jgi:hypothetical protein
MIKQRLTYAQCHHGSGNSALIIDAPAGLPLELTSSSTLAQRQSRMPVGCAAARRSPRSVAVDGIQQEVGLPPVTALVSGVIATPHPVPDMVTSIGVFAEGDR